MEKLLEVSARDADVCLERQVPRMREKFQQLRREVFPAVDRCVREKSEVDKCLQ